MGASMHHPNVVTSDRPCVGCGYNLRGLPLHGACPECGTPIPSSRRSIDDPLSKMPERVVRVFRRGGWLATLCVLFVIALVVAPWFVSWKPAAVVVARAVTALLWWTAVLALTPAVDLPQARWHGFSEDGRLRRWVRWLQLGWVVSAAVGLLVEALPNLTPAGMQLCGLVMTAASATGLVGVVCLAVLLRRLAEWVRDDDAARAFDWFAWAFPLAMVLQALDFPLPWALLALVIVVVAVGLFPLGLLSLSRSMHYSVIHARDAAAQEVRRRERAERDADRTAEAIARMDRARGGA